MQDPQLGSTGAGPVLDALVAALDDAVVLLTSAGIIAGWNPAAERVFGISEPDAIGSPWSLIAADPAGAGVAELADSIHLGQVVERAPLSGRHRDGRPIDLLVTTAPIIGEDGVNAGTCLVARDVTAAGDADQLTVLRERRYQALLEHTADGVQLVDRDGRRLWMSSSFGRLLGITTEELMKTPLWGINHPDDQPAAAKLFAELADQPGASAVIRLRGRHSDGSWRWLESTLTNLLDDPSVAAVVLNVRDVTETQESEERTRTARDQLATILARVSDGILVQDQPGTVLYANDAAAELCGLPSARVLMAQPLREVMDRFELIDGDGASVERDQLPAARVFAGEARAEATIGFRTRESGEVRWALVTAVAIMNWQSRRLLALSVFRDTTRHHRLEAAQREAIEARDRFLSVASHELRTPLTAQKAYVQLLQRRLARGVVKEDLLEGLSVIDRQSDRLIQLVSDLLDVSRLASGGFAVRLKRIDPVELVRRVIADQQVLEPMRRFSLEVTQTGPLDAEGTGHTPESTLEGSAAAGDAAERAESGHPPGTVVADPERLEQVLVNLLQNGRKYSAPDAPIAVSLRSDGEYTRIAVTDQGIGIPEADLPHMFEPFRRAANVDTGISGLGLGLYIAHEIVKAHGGELSVESTLGEGTTFTVALPENGVDSLDGDELNQSWPASG